MLPLLASLVLQSPPPPITADEAEKRVKRVIQALRARGDAQGVPTEYFEYEKIPSPPKLDEGPSGAMMGRRWEIYAETGNGYGGLAWVDASDGFVRSFSWSIPNDGKFIEPAKKRPSDGWFLDRAREYAQAMGANAPLKIDRIEPDLSSGREACWEVWLTQTYQGVPIGEGELVIDGRYGLLFLGNLWPTPNPPKSTKPRIEGAKAKELGLALVRDLTLKRQKSYDPPLDPSRIVVTAPPGLRIVRSPESWKAVNRNPYGEHTADRLPGKLVYKMSIGVDGKFSKLLGGIMYEHFYDVQIDAMTGETAVVSDMVPGMIG